MVLWLNLTLSGIPNETLVPFSGIPNDSLSATNRLFDLIGDSNSTTLLSFNQLNFARVNSPSLIVSIIAVFPSKAALNSTSEAP